MAVKYIFVTGGVVSGLGKGITAASLGRLLKQRGYRVTMLKFDPYINVDPGRMSPYQHGEVFVTDDGAQTDLDIGHYERFIDENLSVDSDVTSGKIYWNVLNKEIKGEYNGVTVQVIPHITNEIKESVYRLGNQNSTDIVITEIGGTVGDIESQPFLESIRQIASEAGRENTIFIHVTLVPCVPGSNELKSKPSQHSVKELLSIGIQPNIIVCRSDFDIPEDMRAKLALFCNTRSEDIIQNLTVDSLYEAPIMLENEGLAKSVCHHLKLEDRPIDLSAWQSMINRMKNATKMLSVAVVGKYVSMPDAYLSLCEALKHAGINNDVKVNAALINSEDIEDNIDSLASYNAILVPSGFGDRGIEGKLAVIKYAREKKIPFLGIGLGMQLTAIDYARNVIGLEDANSTEFDKDTANPVVYIVPEQIDVTSPNGSKMRLGLYPCKLMENSVLREIYGEDLIYERHRSRYEFNRNYLETFKNNGVIVSGISPDEKRIEAIELPKEAHPWFVGVSFNPEFKSRPNHPHPLLEAFIGAAKQKNGNI